MTTTNSSKMTESESANYRRGLEIIRMIPGLERIADGLEEMGLFDRALEAYEGLAMWDDEMHKIGWVRCPTGWAFPPRSAIEATAW